ncbi:MAG TPA: hypothetical protein VGV59_17950 [Pyrinomonadaceae bacterium]|nr:hypothetical protein [Pyrinomonadaceae bacterium]
MKTALFKICLILAACAASATMTTTHAQQQTGGAMTSSSDTAQMSAAAETRPAEPRVPLAERAQAFDADGRTALGGLLRTQQLSGTPDAPERNTRIVIENRSTVFYIYVSGWATFYGADGVRCGEGMWKLEALAPNESAEVDTPGLRLTCAPTTWRIVATNLVTRSGDTAKPGQSAPAQSDAATTSDASALTTTTDTTTTTDARARTVPPLEINVNGKTLPLQLGNPLELTVGRERVRIVVQPAP